MGCDIWGKWVHITAYASRLASAECPCPTCLVVAGRPSGRARPRCHRDPWAAPAGDTQTASERGETRTERRAQTRSEVGEASRVVRGVAAAANLGEFCGNVRVLVVEGGDECSRPAAAAARRQLRRQLPAQRDEDKACSEHAFARDAESLLRFAVLFGEGYGFLSSYKTAPSFLVGLSGSRMKADCAQPPLRQRFAPARPWRASVLTRVPVLCL